MTEETSTAQVPLLDLAPKLKRPLSLWNPLDYLLLLYWVFYFPQAIWWYVETYCEPESKSKVSTWMDRWALLWNSSQKRQLAFMGIFLGIFLHTILYLGIGSIGIQIDSWRFMISVTNGMILSVMFGMLADSVGILVTTNVVSNVIFMMLLTVSSMEENIWRSVLQGFVIGIWIGILFKDLYVFQDLRGFGNWTISMSGTTRVDVIAIFLAIFLPILVIGIASGDRGGLLVMVIGYGVAFLRPDNLFVSSKYIPRISPLRLPRLSRQLGIWLDIDWQNGLMNAKQLLKYSQQYFAVDLAINETLAITPSDNLLHRIALLGDLIWEWDVLRYASISLKDTIKYKFVENIFWLPCKSWFTSLLNANCDFRFDTPARAAAAGFWYLHEAGNYSNTSSDCASFLSKSVRVFSNLRHIEHGEEMYQLVCFLHDYNKVISIEDIINLNSSAFPESQSLRPTTWALLKKITLVYEDIRIVRCSESRTARSFAFNRAVGQTSQFLKDIDSLPDNISRVERSVLSKISVTLANLLLSHDAYEIGQITIDKPIPNPYTIGDPVIGERFIGREDILRQLEELWFINTSPQSVILYGHRRMGKTSILRNATTKVNTEVRVAYVNLLSVSSANNGITDILMAICDALEEVTEIPVPSNNDLLQFPETTFRRYLEQITKTFTGKGLIIALDEFEKIEELIDAGKLSKDFLGFLRGMVQMSSKLAFAFAGLHTLQEMNADYFQPFYASFYAIPVAFLTREATHQVLANPDPEFLLEYEPATLDHIYDLTNGQPYLTQLIGFQLVRLFNDYVFEQGKPRDRTFTIDDVRTICSGENFFNTGINYFNGVWQQAAEGATHQQDILKALAPHPQGLTESELISQTNLPSETLQAALKTLKDHDVIHVQKTNEMVNYAIAVELFRTWVVKYKLSDT